MFLTIANPKYRKTYDASVKPSRWQTDMVAEDLAVVLKRHGIQSEINSDDFDSLISWSSPEMQLWIGVECVDIHTPKYRLEIGAGKRVLLVFGRTFDDAVFARTSWLAELQTLAVAEEELIEKE